MPTGAARVLQQADSYREHTSLTHIANALGESLPAIVCFQGKAHDVALAVQMAKWDPRAAQAAQENGYFTGEHTLLMLQHCLRHVVATRPLVLILDGAGVHLAHDAAQFASENKVHVPLLPSNCTHFQQVADVSVFGPFKQFWKVFCSELKRDRILDDSHVKGIQRSDMVELIAKSWGKAMTPRNIVSGFRRTGIYPFDPQAHNKSLQQHSAAASLTGLPLFIAAIEDILAASAAASALATGRSAFASQGRASEEEAADARHLGWPTADWASHHGELREAAGGE